MTTDKKPLLSFPCDFVIKVFGNATVDFEQQIMAIIQQHQQNITPTVQARPSKDGKYVALSITVHVESQSALDEIYRALSSNPLVLMAL